MNATHDVLDSLRTAGPMGSTELQEHTGRSRTTVSWALRRLVRSRKAVLEHCGGAYRWRARCGKPASYIERLAWVDLASRMGWGKTPPKLAPRLRTGSHYDGCDCVDCLGGVR